MKRRALISILALSVTFAARAEPSHARQYVISEHGAVGDASTVNTKVIQEVIDRCAAGGGGTVVVPKGTFLSGALYFKPGVNLRLEHDAVLKSTTSLAEFPPIYTRWEGIERYWTSAFLNFVGLTGVTVSGEGTIDGSGDAWAGFGNRPRPTGAARSAAPAATARKEPFPNPAVVYPSPLPTTAAIHLAPDPAKLPEVNAAGVALPPMFGTLGPPRAVMFQNCTNVRISGVTLKNQARWGFVFLYCEHVVAENLTARAEHYIPSSDSMDVDSCRDVLITGCDLDCNDDCISIKSGKDEDGRRVNRPCENVVIEKTRFGYGHGGAAMGSESSGGIRNIEVRDCVAEAGNWAPVRIKTQPSRGGVIENITYRNLELRDVKQAFEFNLEWNMRINVAGSTRVPPVVRNVRLINVHGTAGAGGVIHGLKDSFVEKVTFVDCDVTAERPLVIDNARDIDTSGLALHVKDGPPVVWKPAAH